MCRKLRYLCGIQSLEWLLFRCLTYLKLKIYRALPLNSLDIWFCTFITRCIAMVMCKRAETLNLDFNRVPEGVTFHHVCCIISYVCVCLSLLTALKSEQLSL